MKTTQNSVESKYRMARDDHFFIRRLSFILPYCFSLLRRYVVDNFLDDMEELAEDGTHRELNSYFFMAAIIFDVILDIIIRDGLLAIFSLFFVFMWLRINTGSWFLSTVGIFVGVVSFVRVDV